MGNALSHNALVLIPEYFALCKRIGDNVKYGMSFFMVPVDKPITPVSTG